MEGISHQFPLPILSKILNFHQWSLFNYPLFSASNSFDWSLSLIFACHQPPFSIALSWVTQSIVPTSSFDIFHSTFCAKCEETEDFLRVWNSTHSRHQQRNYQYVGLARRQHKVEANKPDSTITFVDVWERGHVKKNGQPANDLVGEKLERLGNVQKIILVGCLKL